MLFSRQRFAVATVATFLTSQSSAQTWSACNPLQSSSCPANPALGKAIDVDFTQGEVNSFVSAGGSPTYGPDGASFTVAGSGDSPQLASVFYIMFGRVEVTMKVAPGAGIVSSLVLQSDDLDEIDNEWLGADGSEMQTNYFGKGITGSYNRGQFHSNPDNQNEFVTYVIDWTSERIVWTIGETAVRTLTSAEAEANQYPQTPMQIKFGAWSGGDPSNAQGTIEWARGPTDYSQGPFTMIVKDVKVTDYSTGTNYRYGDTSGSWQSIQAEGGEVNGNVGNAGSLTTTAVAGAATSTSDNSIPAGIGGTSTQSSSSNLPDGWIITSEGKIVPSSSPATIIPTPLSLSSPSPSAQPSPGAGSSGGEEAITTYDDKGFLTTMYVPSGFETLPKTYDSHGFLVPATETAAAATAAGAAAATNLAKAPALGGASGTIRFPRTSVWAGGIVSALLYILVV